MMLQLRLSADGIVAMGTTEFLLTTVHFQMTLVMNVVFRAVRTTDAEESWHVTIAHE